MTSRFFATTAIALILAGGASAQNETTTAQDTTTEQTAAETETPMAEATADMVLATVNGTDITLGHVIALTSRLPAQYQSLPDQDLFKGVLEQLIQQTALSEGVDREKASVALAIENEVRALMATEHLKQVESAAVTEEAVQAAYDAQFANAEPEQEWKAQHILLETEDAAKDVVAELEGGADFAELAKEKSTGPSGPNGGDLGWQGKGRLVPEFEAAMIALEPGAVSAPVQTQFGWHVIKLNETREKPTPDLASVRATLETQLKQAAVQAELARAAEAADITRPEIAIDPAAIRKLELID